MFKFMWTRRTRLFGGHEISFYRWQHCNKRQSEDARSSQRVGKSSRDTSAASHHLARQGHIPGGNYVRRVSDRVSEVGSENLGVSLFVGNGHTTFGREMTLAKVDCGPRNGGGGQVPCLEVKSMVFHFGRWQKYRTTRDNYLPPSLPFPLPLLLFSPLPFLLFFFLVLSVLSRLCRARFKSTKSTASKLQ